MNLHDKRFQPYQGDSKLMLELLEQSKLLSSKTVPDLPPEPKPLKRNHKSAYQDIEDALCLWYDLKQQNNIKITTFEIRQEALKVARTLGRKDFSASNGWLYKWRQKYMRQELKGMKGEEFEEEIKPVFVPESKKEVCLADVLKKYNCENLFVEDECVVYYKRLPGCYFGGKVVADEGRDERLMVVLCCSLQGDERIRPMIIGPEMDYRVFKKKGSFPCRFIRNENIRMSFAIFYDWLEELNSYFKSKDRKIALFVKPTQEHLSSYTFSHIEVIFYPVKSSNDIHPMDSGITLNFKCHLRKLLCEKCKLFYSFENSAASPSLTDPINILDAIFFVLTAWENINQEVVQATYKSLFQLEVCPKSFGPFASEFVSEVAGLDVPAPAVGTLPIKAHLTLSKQDTFWALMVLKNAVIQLGQPVYKELLALETHLLNKEIKPPKPRVVQESWYPIIL